MVAPDEDVPLLLAASVRDQNLHMKVCLDPATGEFQVSVQTQKWILRTAHCLWENSLPVTRISKEKHKRRALPMPLVSTCLDCSFAGKRIPWRPQGGHFFVWKFRAKHHSIYWFQIIFPMILIAINWGSIPHCPLSDTPMSFEVGCISHHLISYFHIISNHFISCHIISIYLSFISIYLSFIFIYHSYLSFISIYHSYTYIYISFISIIHTYHSYLPIYLSIHLPIHLSTYLFIHPSIYLPNLILSYLFGPILSIPFILSIISILCVLCILSFLSIYLSTYPSIHPSIHPSVCIIIALYYFIIISSYNIIISLFTYIIKSLLITLFRLTSSNTAPGNSCIFVRCTWSWGWVWGGAAMTLWCDVRHVVILRQRWGWVWGGAAMTLWCDVRHVVILRQRWGWVWGGAAMTLWCDVRHVVILCQRWGWVWGGAAMTLWCDVRHVVILRQRWGWVWGGAAMTLWCDVRHVVILRQRWGCPAWDTWRQRDDKPPQRRVKKQALQDSSTVAAVSEMCFPVGLDISDCLEFMNMYIYIYVCIYIYVYKNQCTCPSMQGMCLCLVYHVCNTILTYSWLPCLFFLALLHMDL